MHTHTHKRTNTCIHTHISTHTHTHTHTHTSLVRGNAHLILGGHVYLITIDHFQLFQRLRPCPSLFYKMMSSSKSELKPCTTDGHAHPFHTHSRVHLLSLKIMPIFILTQRSCASLFHSSHVHLSSLKVMSIFYHLRS